VARSLTGVLTNPLMLTLARAVYSDTSADPGALLDPRYADPGLLEGHLLDAFVPAAFTQPPTDDLGKHSAGRSWPADRARGWLSFLAAHLTRLHTQDLAWWQLERAVPWPIRGLLAGAGIAVPLCVLLAISATSLDDPSQVPVFAAAVLAGGVGLAGGLALGMKLFSNEPGATARHGLRANLAAHRHRVGYGCALGLPGGLLLAAATLLVGHNPWRPAFAIAATLTSGIGVGLIFPAAGVTRDLTPSRTPLWRVGLARLIRRLGYGLAFGLTAGLLTAVSFALATSLSYGVIIGGGSLMGRYPNGHIGRLADGTRYVQMSDGPRFAVAPSNKKYVVLRDGTTIYPIDPAVSKQLGGLSFTSDVEARSPDGTISVLDWSTSNWSYLDRSTGNWSVLEWNWYVYHQEPPPPAVAGLLSPRGDQPVDPVSWVVDKTLHGTLFGLLLAQLEDVPYILLIGALFVGLGVGLVGGVYTWLDEPADVTRSISPISTLRTDRTAALLRSLTVVLLVTFAIGLPASGSETNVGLALVDGLYVASPIGLIMVCLTTWGRLAMARCWLTIRGRLPWHMMAFLHEAHRQGILRQAGGVYQFRHARLQDRLSATASSRGAMTSDRPQPSIPDAAPAALPLGEPEP